MYLKEKEELYKKNMDNSKEEDGCVTPRKQIINACITIQKYVREYLNNILTNEDKGKLITEKIFKKYIEKNYIDNIDKLKAFKEYLNKHTNNNKGKYKYIDQCIRRIQNGGKKSGNGSDESDRLKWITEQINNDTDFGIKFKKDYKKFYNKSIKKIDIIGGRQKHYDFIIHHTDGTQYKCEEKGTKDNYNLDKSKTPWEKSVQRLNGNLKDFCIAEIYAKVWYNNVVCSDKINKLIGNTSDIPSFDDWYNNDCCPQGDPKTKWGIENKINYTNKYNGSLTGKNGGIDGRELIIDELKKKFTYEIKGFLIKQIQEKINEIMNEKDIWITTCGKFPNINYRFWNHIEPETIKNIKIKYNKGADVIFECIVEKGNNFECWLRWGKGCGFSNLRFDIR
tara:strand:+ start:700 stop:1881 length:1182 start_codon:yes stop_codon:yes gene_type:complete